MADEKTGCLICGKELVYLDQTEMMQCSYCRSEFDSNASCADGHYICDRCHGLDAMNLIQEYCSSSQSKDPLEMALTLMRNPKVKMHGPEHHFLVPAVLITAYFNVTNKEERENNIENRAQTRDPEPETRNDLKKMLKKARGRAENILGGFCGLYGDCGAAVGTGIFISIITGATPLTKESWSLSNLITARSLHTIALHGGPRCCKRNTYLALTEAVAFLKEHFDVDLEMNEDIKCEFNSLNKECLEDECRYFKTR